MRKGNICSFASAEKSLGEPLLRFAYSDSKAHSDQFFVEADTPGDGLWAVVRGRGTHAAHLEPGDVLKLGRVQLRVKAVSLTGDEAVSLDCLQTPVAVRQYAKSETEPTANCRVCLSEEQSDSNPLVSVCECAGTVKYVHLECLQEWLRTRLDIDHTPNVLSYHWRSLDCELCKTTFPVVIALEDRTVSLVDVNKSNYPFIVLEESNRRERGDVHVVSMRESAEVIIGRSPNCDIVMSDVSVSREHCALRLGTSGFTIEDRESKFGTLKRVRGTRLALAKGREILLQISRTIVSLEMRQPNRVLYFCCHCCFSRSAAVVPESTILKHTISSVFVTTSNPHTENPENTDQLGSRAGPEPPADEENSQLIEAA